MISIVSYGGGVNSTAMLVGMVHRAELPPHAILFADTGGEKPHTYDYIAMFSEWLQSAGYPAITIVKKGGRDESLEQDCLRRKTLPSVAFGFKTCSLKYKIEPQEKWANNDPECKEAWARGNRVIRQIGFHIGERSRVRTSDDPKYLNNFPLIKWFWDQDECEAAIKRANLPPPGKSACFFCPNSRPSEIRQLAAQYPDLAARAVAMENNAHLTHIKGLGRYFSWRDVLSQTEMFPYHSAPDMPCGCYDGEAA